jgi:outer membrane biosynthesis protein TonB
MRFATFLTALGAAVAIASPIHQALHKRVIVYDIITETDYVTVTEGAVPTQTPEGVKTVLISTTVWVNPVEASEPSSYAVPPPPPAPTTTCITTEPTPAPAAPTTTEPAPAAVPTTTSEAPPPAEPAPTTTTEEAAPVAQSTTSVAAVAAASPTDYNSAAIDHHNYHRANHSAPDITWSDSLAASALVVANSCVFAHDM